MKIVSLEAHKISKLYEGYNGMCVNDVWSSDMVERSKIKNKKRTPKEIRDSMTRGYIQMLTNQIN